MKSCRVLFVKKLCGDNVKKMFFGRKKYGNFSLIIYIIVLLRVIDVE